MQKPYVCVYLWHGLYPFERYKCIHVNRHVIYIYFYNVSPSTWHAQCTFRTSMQYSTGKGLRASKLSKAGKAKCSRCSRSAKACNFVTNMASIYSISLATMVNVCMYLYKSINRYGQNHDVTMVKYKEITHSHRFGHMYYTSTTCIDNQHTRGYK